MFLESLSQEPGKLHMPEFAFAGPAEISTSHGVERNGRYQSSGELFQTICSQGPNPEWGARVEGEAGREGDGACVLKQLGLERAPM